MTPIDVKSNIDIRDSFRCPIFCCVGKKKRNHRKSGGGHIEDRVDNVATGKIKRSPRIVDFKIKKESDEK